MVYARETGRDYDYAMDQLAIIFRRPHLIPGVKTETYLMAHDIWTIPTLDDSMARSLAAQWCGWRGVEVTRSP